MRSFTVDYALRDLRLLGAALGDLGPWSTWLAVCRAAFALELDDGEREVFRKIAGERAPPTRVVRELWCICGRRSGKSRMAAALAVFLALFQRHKLAKGEIGHVLVLAATADQAKTVFEYAAGFLESSEALRREVRSITAHEIRLANDVIIGVHVNNFRTVRGKTLLAAIFDEVSFWRDEVSATPDIETYRACMPSLIASGGMLIGISTPYRRVGLLHSKHRDHFGVDGDDDVLVVQGGSELFNPTLSAELIAAHRASDPEAAVGEWDACFRSDIAALLSEDLIEAAIDHDRPLELPPRKNIRYAAFCDPSGGRGDAFALCIGHYHEDKFIADVVRTVEPPFNPGSVVADFSALLKQYGASTVVGDHYSGEWVTGAFKTAGIKYVPADRPKSALYLETLPLFARGLVALPHHPRLIRELRLLERRTHRSGKDTVDHGRSGHDDAANALAGCMVLGIEAARRAAYTSMAWVG